MTTFESEPIIRIGVSPDNTLVALGGKQQLIIYNRNNQNTKTLVGHQDSFNNLAFSRNGQYLVSADFSGIVKIWNTATMMLIKEFHMNENAVDEDEAIAAEGRFNSDDSQLLLGGFGDISLYRVEGWEKIYTKRSFYPSITVAFLPKEPLLVVGDGCGGIYKVNPTTRTTRKIKKTVFSSDLITRIVPNPIAKVCFIWDEFNIFEWQYLKNSWRVIANFGNYSVMPGDVLPAKNLLITALMDEHNSSVFLIDGHSGEIKSEMKVASFVNDVVFSADGKMIFVGHDAGFTQLDLNT